MKHVVFAGLLALSLLPLWAQADMLPEGEHAVENCVSLDNASEFSDYRFFVYTEYMFPKSELLGGDPVCSQKGPGELFAVKEEDVSKMTKDPKNESFIIWSQPFGLNFPVLLPNANSVTKKNFLVHLDGFQTKKNLTTLQAHLVKTENINNSQAVISIEDASSLTAIFPEAQAAEVLGAASISTASKGFVWPEEIFFLLLTIVLELPIALILLRKENWRRVALTVLGVNLISHPIIWQLVNFYSVNWFLAEAGVAVFEGLVFAAMFKNRRMFAGFTAIFMNIVTAAIGFLFF